MRRVSAEALGNNEANVVAGALAQNKVHRRDKHPLSCSPVARKTMAGKWGRKAEVACTLKQNEVNVYSCKTIQPPVGVVGGM